MRGRGNGQKSDLQTLGHGFKICNAVLWGESNTSPRPKQGRPREDIQASELQVLSGSWDREVQFPETFHGASFGKGKKNMNS